MGNDNGKHVMPFDTVYWNGKIERQTTYHGNHCHVWRYTYYEDGYKASVIFERDGVPTGYIYYYDEDPNLFEGGLVKEVGTIAKQTNYPMAKFSKIDEAYDDGCTIEPEFGKIFGYSENRHCYVPL